MRIWVVALSLVLLGCGTEPSKVAIGQPFDVAVGKTQAVDEGIRVTFTAVTDDSRCPVDVQCVWAGNAALSIVLRTGSGTTSGVLNTSRPNDAVTIGSFEVRVRGLDPPAMSTRTIDPKDYIATLVVEATGR